MVVRGKYSEIFDSTSKYSILRILLFVVSYIFYILITRLLGPEEFGKLALLIQLGTEIGTILLIGLPMTLTRFIPGLKSREEQGKLFSSSINISLVIFAGFALIYFPVTYFFSDHIPAEIIEAKYFLFSFILVLGIVKLGIGMLSGLGRFIGGTVFDGSTHLVWRLGGLLLLLFTVFGNFRTLFGINVLVHLLTMLVLLIVLRQYLRPAGLKIDPMIMKFALTVMGSQAVFAIIIIIDPLLIRLILDSPSQVGFFYTGTRIPYIFQTLFFAPLSVPFLYYFSRSDSSPEQKDDIIRSATRMLSFIFGIISLFVYTFADKFILLFFSDEFEGSILVLKIFAFSLFLVAMEVFLNPYFLSVNKPFVPVILGASYLVLVTGLNFIFIPIFQSAGPPVSILICMVLRVGAYIILLKKQGIDLIKTYAVMIIIMAVSVLIDIFLLKYTGIFIFIILAFATRTIRIKNIKNMIGMLRKNAGKNN